LFITTFILGFCVAGYLLFPLFSSNVWISGCMEETGKHHCIAPALLGLSFWF